MQPWLEDLWREHRGKMVGAAVGFAFGLLWRWLGFFWALWIGLLTAAGYWVGRRYDEEPEALGQWLERLGTRSRGG